jgi:hypothetical protein
MSFQKGRQKTGGRKKGVPNRRTPDLASILEEHNYSPVADLIESSRIAKENFKNDPSESKWLDISVKCAAAMIPYVYPKRKPVEGIAELREDEVKDLSTDKLIEYAKEAITALEN